MGANAISRLPDSARHTRNVHAGQGLPVRLSPTVTDTLNRLNFPDTEAVEFLEADEALPGAHRNGAAPRHHPGEQDRRSMGAHAIVTNVPGQRWDTNQEGRPAPSTTCSPRPASAVPISAILASLTRTSPRTPSRTSTRRSSRPRGRGPRDADTVQRTPSRALSCRAPSKVEAVLSRAHPGQQRVDIAAR
jgi:hypothetical protein